MGLLIAGVAAGPLPAVSGAVLGGRRPDADALIAGAGLGLIAAGALLHDDLEDLADDVEAGLTSPAATWGERRAIAVRNSLLVAGLAGLAGLGAVPAGRLLPRRS